MTPTTPSTADEGPARSVGGFYDRWTDLFLAGSGPVLQAGHFRTGDPPVEEPEQSVLELARRAGVEDGDRILDAGCGVAGPAISIATRYPNVTIEGVTVSPAQAAIAQDLLRRAGMHRRVHALIADYHELPFAPESFQRVLFFESTGYARDLDAVYAEAFRVLEPGGGVYVKDVFCRPGPLSVSDSEAMHAFDQLWGCVRSKTLLETTAALRRAGFDIERSGVLEDIGTARLLGAMFQFDAKSGLRRSDMGDAFWREGLDPPIEFGEIKATKPVR